MNKLLLALAATVCVGASLPAAAHSPNKDEMRMGVKMMDTDHDGTVSKDEFMKFHETMFDRMDKDKSGTLNSKELRMGHEKMMKRTQAKGQSAKAAKHDHAHHEHMAGDGAKQ